MTPAKLQLADDQELPLPIDVVTQRLAFMGRPGSGKSYAAKKLFEMLVAAHVQAIPIDVVGIWYGVRLAPDGKSPGLAVPIFGGLHGDVPLEPGAGAMIADLVVDRNLTAVLDISQMDDPDQTKFATDFGRRFFQRKKSAPSPVMLFLEECQELIPQNPMKDETRKLHIYQRIAKLGRNYGIGISLISQRPQDVNKKALNLTELMLAFQIVAPTERRTMRDWMVASGVDGDEDLNTLLPKLKVGHARVYSPAWLEVQKTIHIARSETYDSSATPKVGAKRVKPKALTPIDLEQIAVAMRETVERAKANDPRELKAEIARLKKQLGAGPSKAPAAAPAQVRVETKVQRVEIPVFREGQVKRLEQAQAGAAQNLERLAGLSAALKDAAREITAAVQAATKAAAAANRTDSPRPAAAARSAPPRALVPAARPASAPRPAVPVLLEDSLGNPAELKVTPALQRILDVLAWLESIGVRPASKGQVALLAGQSPSGGGYVNNLSSLRTGGLIDYPAPAKVELTDSGHERAISPDAPLTTAELQRAILARVGPTKGRILQVLIDEFPDPISKADLAERAGQAAGGGGYVNNLSALRGLGLIDYPTPGQAVALPVLFLE